MTERRNGFLGLFLFWNLCYYPLCGVLVVVVLRPWVLEVNGMIRVFSRDVKHIVSCLPMQFNVVITRWLGVFGIE